VIGLLTNITTARASIYFVFKLLILPRLCASIGRWQPQGCGPLWPNSLQPGPCASADITGWPQKPKEAMMLRAFTAVSILVLTVTTAKAYPNPPIEVTFGDLDLSRPSDANVLRERVLQATNIACGQLQFASPSPPSLYYRTWFRDCVSATSARTMTQVEARAGQYLTFASK
jgi:UrcA family protein